MVAQARVTNKPLKNRATDVMINLTSPGDEELECVVGEESGQLESENHPWVSRDVVLFQIPERGSQNERVQYVEDQSSMNCTLISNCGKAFLMSGLTILSTASILEKTRSKKEEDKACPSYVCPCRLSRIHPLPLSLYLRGYVYLEESDMFDMFDQLICLP